jgi:hypothetical protein
VGKLQEAYNLRTSKHYFANMLSKETLSSKTPHACLNQLDTDGIIEYPQTPSLRVGTKKHFFALFKP